MNVAIVGRPNVGKSALFNRLVGRNVAIVHDQPGITRDRISGVSKKGKRPFNVWDTGGIVGVGESELTDDVRRVVREAMNESDVLLFVVDAKTGLNPIDAEIARLLRKTRKPVVLVTNKIDNEKHEPLAAEFDSLGFDQNVSISAAHGRGIGELLDQIDNFLPENSEERTSNLEPPTALAIAIVGRPNVGKSSLINAIVEQPRAIVSEIAGTTRDAVDISFAHDDQRFIFIDTAGIRRRGAHSSSVEVFSVMRAERSIKRADVCVLIVDLTSGVTAQDKRIAGLIQEARKPCIVVLNKFDLARDNSFGLTERVSRREVTKLIETMVARARAEMFFLDYAPMLVASAKTGENVERLFRLIDKLRGAARKTIGTGVLNRLLRGAFEANPPPMVSGKRLKLFYVTQDREGQDRQLPTPKFVLFVNDPRLMNETYGRYLVARIRDAEPFVGLPITLTLRPRAERA